jgi:vancomycin resistance protein YoaR
MPGFAGRLGGLAGFGDRTWSRLLVLAAVAAGVAGFVVLLSAVAFVAEERANSRKVVRNVTLAGRNVSLASSTTLNQVIAELDRSYAATEVTVEDTGGGRFVTQAGTIGLRVNQAATATELMEVGRRGSMPRRWWSWLGSFTRARHGHLSLSIDQAAVAGVVAQHASTTQTAPVEASIQLDQSGKFVGVAGKAGQGIDPNQLADAVEAAAQSGAPIKVKVRRSPVEPRFTKADADALAKRAEELVAQPRKLVAEGTKATLATNTRRGLLTSAAGPAGLELRVDEAAAAAAAEKALAAAGTRPVEPTFRVEANNTLTPVPGAPGRGCCGPDTGKAVAVALLQGGDQPVEVTLVVKQPKLTAQAASFGVKEEVSTFATKHACCQPRVTNIHRIADLVRGQLIPPGQSFSVNEFVGERTTQKGFVVDKVIAEGRYEQDVGGGVSQFATTLFNAAWFAGLEFGEYQSHSLVIGRYPKGREATLGFPHPDLVIKNPSPHGVMIWPTYTDTEIRVTLYSTKWVAVTATGQDIRPNGACTLYITKRQRTFLDGRVTNDFTKAQYRRREGVACG